ncbi:MAG: formyltransferase family protein [Thermodesulfobacteriota bacterium]
MRKLKTALMANWGLGREILRYLLDRSEIELVLIVTDWREDDPDQWRNAVYRLAGSKGLEIIPEKGLSFTLLRSKLMAAGTDLLLVHAFKRRLPRAVYSAPRMGTVNIHPSLLPRYRGPAPAYWVLKNREIKSGLTAHFVDDGLDTGAIVHQVELPLRPDDTLESLLERQKALVNDLMTETLRRLLDSGFKPRPQDETLASYAPRPHQPGEEIHVHP